MKAYDLAYRLKDTDPDRAVSICKKMIIGLKQAYNVEFRRINRWSSEADLFACCILSESDPIAPNCMDSVFAELERFKQLKAYCNGAIRLRNHQN